MRLKEQLDEFTSPEQVDQFLKRHPTCALFKAGGCHKTMQGYGYVEEALLARPEIFLGLVRVIENRPVSNYITEITGITHQSPQFILFVEGEPVYDVDNWDIVPDALEHALNTYLGPKVSVKKTESDSLNQEAIEPYFNLLRKFISREIAEIEFKNRWLAMFQMDASLRSKHEFDVLNGLFVDVDQAIAETASGEVADHNTQIISGLREKAEILFKRLESLTK